MFIPGRNASPHLTGQVVFDITPPGLGSMHNVVITLRDDDTGVVLGRRPVELEDTNDLPPLVQRSLFDQVGGVYRLESVRLDMRTAALAKRTAAIESRVRRKRRRRAITLPKKTRFLDCVTPTIGSGRENPRQVARSVSEVTAESLPRAWGKDVSCGTSISGRPSLRLINCSGPEPSNARNLRQSTGLRSQTSPDTPSAPHLRLVPEEDCGRSVSDAWADALQAAIARIMAEDS